MVLRRCNGQNQYLPTFTELQNFHYIFYQAFTYKVLFELFKTYGYLYNRFKLQHITMHQVQSHIWRYGDNQDFPSCNYPVARCVTTELLIETLNDFACLQICKCTNVQNLISKLRITTRLLFVVFITNDSIPPFSLLLDTCPYHRTRCFHMVVLLNY